MGVWVDPRSTPHLNPPVLGMRLRVVVDGPSDGKELLGVFKAAIAYSLSDEYRPVRGGDNLLIHSAVLWVRVEPCDHLPSILRRESRAFLLEQPVRGHLCDFVLRLAHGSCCTH